MAVYTEVEGEQIQALLGDLDLGRLRTFEGVADGVENTTYFVTTE
ncbi:MAG: homoserine kinase, partial [Gammaproteobacteria bacterium]